MNSNSLGLISTHGVGFVGLATGGVMVVLMGEVPSPHLLRVPFCRGWTFFDLKSSSEWTKLFGECDASHYGTHWNFLKDSEKLLGVGRWPEAGTRR